MEGESSFFVSREQGRLKSQGPSFHFRDLVPARETSKESGLTSSEPFRRNFSAFLRDVQYHGNSAKDSE